MNKKTQGTLKSYKQCLTLCRRMIASEQFEAKEEAITRFLKNAKRQILRQGEDYTTISSDNMYNILSGMEA